MDLLKQPLEWLRRAFGARDADPRDADPEGDYTVDGCFTLPGARLDDLADPEIEPDA